MATRKRVYSLLERKEKSEEFVLQSMAVMEGIDSDSSEEEESAEEDIAGLGSLTAMEMVCFARLVVICIPFVSTSPDMACAQVVPTEPPKFTHLSVKIDSFGDDELYMWTGFRREHLKELYRKLGIPDPFRFDYREDKNGNW